MSVQSQVSDQNPSHFQNHGSLQWRDLEGHFVSLQNSMEARLKEIEAKETQINDRLRELEARERRTVTKLRDIGVIVDSQNLLSLLGDSVFELENFCGSVARELGLCDEPGKLVLDAVGELNRELENVELENVGKRSCVVLLEQLAAVGPRIAPAVKDNARGLAREWMAKIAAEREQKKKNGVLEVLRLLLLLGVYDLVDEFDSGDVLSVLRSIGKIRGDESGVELGSADNDLASIEPVSKEKNSNRSLEQDFEYVKNIAAAFACPVDALECFCVKMDGKNLKLFLHENLGEQDWSAYVHDALILAPDSAKLVLDTMPGFLRPQHEFHKSLSKARIRKSCILLLEQLMIMSPLISPNVKEEALMVVDEWKLKMGQIYQSSVIAYGFLLFLAAYKLNYKFKTDELLRILEISNTYKASLRLCSALGLTDKAEVLVQNLIQRGMLLDAVDHVYAYNLVGKFSPVQLLADYLNQCKQKIHNKRNNSSLQQAADREITVTRTIINYISKYSLDSKFPPEKLEKRIMELETMKRAKVIQKTCVPATRGSCASITIESEVKIELPPKEDSQLKDVAVKADSCPKEGGLKLENQIEKVGNEESSSSMSRWPLLESLCINVCGKGLSFFSRKYTQEINTTASASTSPWPELKSICVNMDGKSLRTFLYDHVDDDHKNDQVLLCSEVLDALKCASDPAKLVLDVMPGFLLSQPEFDKKLLLKKVIKSRIILLEQLITISPQTSPCVKEEALKMAKEWMGNFGKKYNASGVVYGFLHFVAAYGLVSNYEADELLGLLINANCYKATPSLCRNLGLGDKVIVLIESLRKKNLLLEAIEHIYAFNLADKYKPVRLLKDYLYSRRTISFGSIPPKNAIDKEILAARSIIACIAKHKLESEYPPEDLEIHIAELEKQKALLSNANKGKITSPIAQASSAPSAI